MRKDFIYRSSLYEHLLLVCCFDTNFQTLSRIERQETAAEIAMCVVTGPQNRRLLKNFEEKQNHHDGHGNVHHRSHRTELPARQTHHRCADANPETASAVEVRQARLVVLQVLRLSLGPRDLDALVPMLLRRRRSPIPLARAPLHALPHARRSVSTAIDSGTESAKERVFRWGSLG